MGAHIVRSPEMALGIADGFSLKRLVVPRGLLADEDGVLKRLSQWTSSWTDTEIRVARAQTGRPLAIGYARGMRMRAALAASGATALRMSPSEMEYEIRKRCPSATRPIENIRIEAVTSRRATNGEGFVELLPSTTSANRIWQDRRAVRSAVVALLGLELDASSQGDPFHYPDCRFVVAHTSPGVNEEVANGIKEGIGRYVPTRITLEPLSVCPINDHITHAVGDTST